MRNIPLHAPPTGGEGASGGGYCTLHPRCASDGAMAGAGVYCKNLRTACKRTRGRGRGPLATSGLFAFHPSRLNPLAMSITAPEPAPAPVPTPSVERRYLNMKEEELYLNIRLENVGRPIKAGYSDVHPAHFAGRPGDTVAVKHPKYTMDNATQNELMDTALEKEITVLKRVRHPNILPFIGLVRHHEDPCIVTPWMKNGSLCRYLKIRPDADRFEILRDVAIAVEYLHSGAELPGTSYVIHGDIHAGNVLISDEGKALLADFGLSKLVPLNEQASLSLRPYDKAQGMTSYMAPELHAKDALRSLCSDVFAYGMLIYETYAGIRPNVLVDELLSGQRPERASISRNDLTDAVWQVACDCWEHSPSDRPTMREVIAKLGQAPELDISPATSAGDTVSICDGGHLKRLETKCCNAVPPGLYLPEDINIPFRPVNRTSESEVYRAHYTDRPDDVVAVRRMRYGVTHPLTNTAFENEIANGERDEDHGVEVHRAETGRISGCRSESADPGEPNRDSENEIADRESIQNTGTHSRCIPCAEKGRSTCECRSERPSIYRKRVRLGGFFSCAIWRSCVEMPALRNDGLPGLFHKGPPLLHSPGETSPIHVQGKSDRSLRRVVIHDLTPFITIGRGRPFAISPCSDLYKVTLLENIPVVVRRIRYQDDETTNESRLRNAAAILVGARHIHVLHYIGTCEFEGSLCIVSVFAAGGDLRKHLAAHPDCDRMSILPHVAQGLLYLHQSVIVHGNLHPSNVLLSDDGKVKISDFGLADIIPQDQGSTTMRSAFAREKAMHRAPETHMGHELSSSSDVYSFAMLVFYAYSDGEPMIERYPDAIQVVAALMSGKRPQRVEISRSDFSENLWNLVEQCWTAEKEKRPSMSAVLEAISKETPTPTAL